MARPVWKGGATAVAQATYITPESPADTAAIMYITLENRAGESHKLTAPMTSAADTTIASVCTQLVTAITSAVAAGEDPFDEVSASTAGASPAGSDVVITADSAGEPFFVTSLTTNETATMTSSVKTAVQGPSIFSDSDNWDGEAAPVAGDVPIFPANAGTDVFGEAFDSSVVLGGLVKEAGCSINIGSHDRPLTMNFATDKVIDLDGTGSVYLKVGHAATTICDSVVINITGAGAGSAIGTYGVNILGADTTVSAYVSCEANETVSFAARGGDTGELKEVKVGSGNVSIGSSIGSGTALPLTLGGGTVYNSSNVGVLAQDGGVLYHGGVATMTSANIDDGTTYYKSSGTLTSGTIAGTIDFSQDMRYRTIDSSKGLTLQKGAVVRDPHGTVGGSGTAGSDVVVSLAKGVTLGDVSVDLGDGGKFTRTP